MAKINNLEQILDYKFHNIDLLETAMTHSSYANEHHCESYERLEFLGDSVLGYITADFLYRTQPAIPEGRMTRLRAELVCEESLYAIASRLGFGRFLRLGRGAEAGGGRTRQSILADLVEASIAAMYIDGGMEPARRFVYEQLLRYADVGAAHRDKDYKTSLQELVQSEGKSVTYELLEESGPDHDKRFAFAVLLDGQEIGRGIGRSKKEAEQMAAGNALKELEA